MFRKHLTILSAALLLSLTFVGTEAKADGVHFRFTGGSWSHSTHRGWHRYWGGPTIGFYFAPEPVYIVDGYEAPSYYTGPDFWYSNPSFGLSINLGGGYGGYRVGEHGYRVGVEEFRGDRGGYRVSDHEYRGDEGRYSRDSHDYRDSGHISGGSSFGGGSRSYNDDRRSGHDGSSSRSFGSESHSGGGASRSVDGGGRDGGRSGGGRSFGGGDHSEGHDRH